MTQLSDLEFLRLSGGQKFGYKVSRFFAGIPGAFLNFFKMIWGGLKKCGTAVGAEIADIVNTFVHGDWKTKTSYLIMGFGNLARGQVLRGLLFLLFEVVFIGYMIMSGGYWLSMLPSLGKVGPSEEYSEVLDAYRTVYHDNSFQILLYGVLTIFFIIAFIYTWRVNVKQNRIAEKILERAVRMGRKVITVPAAKPSRVTRSVYMSTCRNWNSVPVMRKQMTDMSRAGTEKTATWIRPK